MAKMNRTDIIITRAEKELEYKPLKRAELENHVAEYLARGGVIEKLPSVEVEPGNYSPVHWGAQTQVM